MENKRKKQFVIDDFDLSGIINSVTYAVMINSNIDDVVEEIKFLDGCIRPEGKIFETIKEKNRIIGDMITSMTDTMVSLMTQSNMSVYEIKQKTRKRVSLEISNNKDFGLLFLHVYDNLQMLKSNQDQFEINVFGIAQKATNAVLIESVKNDKATKLLLTEISNNKDFDLLFLHVYDNLQMLESNQNQVEIDAESIIQKATNAILTERVENDKVGIELLAELMTISMIPIIKYYHLSINETC